MSGQPKKQFSLTWLLRILIGTLVVVSVVVFAGSLMKYNALREDYAELLEEKQKLGAEKEELEELEALAEENYFEYVVRIAKRKLGLFFPDEEIYYNDLNE